MPIFTLSKTKVEFPPPELATAYGGLLAVGGDLRVERLLQAYSNGIFPWPSDDVPLAWWSPDPRFVVYPEALKVPKSLARVMKKEPFTFTVDRCFADVIHHCSATERPDQDGTWITTKIRQAYIALHQAGHAHSFEAWSDGRLVGGLYGVSLGRCFFGESMFAHAPDASKSAFVTLAKALFQQGCPFIDCQVYTDHLARFGAEEIPRARFLSQLRSALASPSPSIDWAALV